MPGSEFFGKEEIVEVIKVLDRGVLHRYAAEQMLGVSAVREFEKKFAEYMGSKYALGVMSGTAALKVAMAALGVGPGDEVITSCFTFVATPEAILDCGAIPVFVNIDETLNLDPEDLEKNITDRTKVVIAVHMTGVQAKIDEIKRITDKHGIYLIEDNAQACGASYKGRKLGTFGHFGTFSFDFYKPITTGEGGMVITDDEELFFRADCYHDHGHIHDMSVPRALEKRYSIGFNYRMSELQGALGLAQISKMDEVIRRHKENKRYLKERIAEIKGITFREIPDPEGEIASTLTVFLPSREKALAFKEGLSKRGIGVAHLASNRWHFVPNWEHMMEWKSLLAHRCPFECAFNDTLRKNYSPEKYARSTGILERALSLDISAKVEKERLDKIVSAFAEVAKEVL
ncbi:MAG: DegT/DnrJ/EryC1/StrS family aminotransferase [Synergistetes bacterium]|nr:MAG: PLP-dependent enzyme [bacterium 42_11]MBC7330802.1 DegT/DnrJ/EryC1/StrS family aminotransferase [Synergistota bacterium]